MQSEAPQGDPRLQRTDRGPVIATGFVDPCIVFLETTLSEEIPLLVACWARSSREIREPGRATSLALKNVVVCKCTSHRKLNGKYKWHVTTRHEKSLVLKHGLAEGSPRFSYFSPSMSAQPPTFNWAIRYLDFATDASLAKEASSICSPNSNRAPLIKQILERSHLDWPSIADVLACDAVKHHRTSVGTRRSFMRRVISSVFKKKLQPAHA